jgi:hypothetical protein
MGEGGGFAVRGLEPLDIREPIEAHLVRTRSVARLMVARATDADLEALQAANDAVNLTMPPVSSHSGRGMRIEPRKSPATSIYPEEDHHFP